MIKIDKNIGPPLFWRRLEGQSPPGSRLLLHEIACHRFHLLPSLLFPFSFTSFAQKIHENINTRGGGNERRKRHASLFIIRFFFNAFPLRIRFSSSRLGNSHAKLKNAGPDERLRLKSIFSENRLKSFNTLGYRDAGYPRLFSILSGIFESRIIIELRSS